MRWQRHHKERRHALGTPFNAIRRNHHNARFHCLSPKNFTHYALSPIHYRPVNPPTEPSAPAGDALPSPVPEVSPLTGHTVVPEVGGRREGLDPTRYGDWEKGGRCIDF